MSKSYNSIHWRLLGKKFLICLLLIKSAFALTMSQAAAAEETEMVAVQMITSTDVQNAANPSLLEGVEEVSYGAIYFPDKVFLAKVTKPTDDAQSIYDSWAKTHRFFVASFNIGVRPNGDKIPERVDISLALDGLGDLTKSPIITDIFPSSSFKKSAFQGEANLNVSAGGDFVEGASAKAGVGFSYKYSPAYANVFSGFATTHAFWRFSRTQDSYPIGNIPMKILLIVPKLYKESKISGDFDVKVQFRGGIFSRGAVISNFTTIFSLP